jgi:hypothetical protein
MRRIDIVDGLSIRFPNRSEEFLEGVEIGVMAGALAFSPARYAFEVSRGARAQAVDLARNLGYRVVEGPATGDGVALTLIRADVRPSLQVVARAARGGS